MKYQIASLPLKWPVMYYFRFCFGGLWRNAKKTILRQHFNGNRSLLDVNALLSVIISNAMKKSVVSCTACEVGQGGEGRGGVHTAVLPPAIIFSPKHKVCRPARFLRVIEPVCSKVKDCLLRILFRYCISNQGLSAVDGPRWRSSVNMRVTSARDSVQREESLELLCVFASIYQPLILCRWGTLIEEYSFTRSQKPVSAQLERV